jgi:hypothetical protein
MCSWVSEQGWAIDPQRSIARFLFMAGGTAEARPHSAGATSGVDRATASVLHGVPVRALLHLASQSLGNRIEHLGQLPLRG